MLSILMPRAADQLVGGSERKFRQARLFFDRFDGVGQLRDVHAVYNLLLHCGCL
jgi:hypothetical protein